MLFVLLSALQVGCTHTQLHVATQIEASQAYEDGDYLSAYKHYNRENCITQKSDTAAAFECAARAREVEAGLVGAARYLGKRSVGLLADSKASEQNDYYEAARCLRLGLRLLPSGHGERQIFAERLQQIEMDLANFEQEYADQYAKLEGLLGHEGYGEEQWKDILRSFERLRVLRIVLRKPDRRLKELAQRCVAKLDEAADYERAAVATNLAIAVDFRGTEFHTASQVADVDLIFFAFVGYRSQKEKSIRQEAIEALLVDIEREIRSKRIGNARYHIQDVLALNPEPKTARRLQRILATIDGLAHGLPRGNKTLVVHGDSPLDGGAAERTSDRSSHEAYIEPPDISAEMQELLDHLVQQFESGDSFGAIVGLDKVVRDFEEKPQQVHARKLQQIWEPIRQRLILEHLSEADRLFVDENPASLEHYQRVLQLNLTNGDSERVKERIDILTRILGQ